MSEEKSIVIEMFGGVVIDVFGLPEGVSYIICDHDEGDNIEECIETANIDMYDIPYGEEEVDYEPGYSFNT